MQFDTAVEKSRTYNFATLQESSLNYLIRFIVHYYFINLNE
jgi:hypothetical protein